MTSLTGSVNNLGTAEYISYEPSDNVTKPIPVGPIVSKSKGLTFTKGWPQSDTADRCHKNAFLMYDQYRRWEDDHMISNNIEKKPGLSMRFVNSKSPYVNSFNGRQTDGYDISAPTQPIQSVEFFGFFMPSSTGTHKFSIENNTTADYRIWLGDVACHEYLDTNQISEMLMYANRYYAVRIQYSNRKSTVQNAKIQVMGPDNNIMINPKFESLLNKNGKRFNRNLLYYGLVKAETPNQYYCYFNGRSDYNEIRNAKGIDVIERVSGVIPSDANPPPRSGTITARDWRDNLKLNAKSDNIHEVSINNAQYAVQPGSGYKVPKLVPETNPNKLIEKYPVVVYKDKFVYQKIRGKTVRVKIRVPETKMLQRPKNPVPMKTIWETVVPPPLNVTKTAKDIIADKGDIDIKRGTYNDVWKKDPAPGLAKRSILDYTTSIREDARINKTIKLSDKCALLVNYNGMPDATAEIIPAPAVCNDRRIILNSDGTVKINGTTWIDIIKDYVLPADKEIIEPNPNWKGVASELKLDNLTAKSSPPLTTLVSPDMRFKLVFSNGKLKCYYNVKATYTDSAGEKYSLANSDSSSPPQALYLYRPNYSELGGKKYSQRPKASNPNESELVWIKSNHEKLKTSDYKGQTGYPIQQYQYLETTGDCREICTKDPKLKNNCGNYVTNSSGKCFIDQTANLRPMFATTKPPTGPFAGEINPPTIYIKNQTMNGKPFTSSTAGNYSEYEIEPDRFKKNLNIDAAPNEFSENVNATYSLYSFITEKLIPEKEGFSDIPPRFSNQLPNAPETSVEEGRIEDLQTIMFQQNVLYSVSSIAALSFLVGAIVLANK
jgi:hypothetical protein